MSYTFEKTFTKRWEVTSVCLNFMNFGDFYRVRQDKKKCELCNRDFTEKDMAHLAFVKGRKNHLICTECATEAVEGGANSYDMRNQND